MVADGDGGAGAPEHASEAKKDDTGYAAQERGGALSVGDDRVLPRFAGFSGSSVQQLAWISSFPL